MMRLFIVVFFLFVDLCEKINALGWSHGIPSQDQTSTPPTAGPKLVPGVNSERAGRVISSSSTGSRQCQPVAWSLTRYGQRPPPQNTLPCVVCRISLGGCEETCPDESQEIVCH